MGVHHHAQLGVNSRLRSYTALFEPSQDPVALQHAPFSFTADQKESTTLLFTV